jgi:hypothetical protein
LLAADAGCSDRLAGARAGAAQNAAPVTTERGYAASRPAIALELRRSRKERLTIFVIPRTEQPLVAFVDLAGLKITARIYLPRVTRPVLHRFGLLHMINPEPKL